MDPGSISSVAMGIFFGGLALLVAHELGARRDPWAIAVVYILALWPIVVTLSLPRILTSDANAGVAWLDSAAWQDALSLPAWILTGWLAAYASVRLVNRGWQLLPREGLQLWLAHLACVSGPLLGALLGTPGGGMSHALLRPHLMLTALVLAVTQRPRATLAALKWGCLAYVAGSLIAVVIAPGWALFESGEFLGGPLPLPRLFGVGGHPNGLAPIALAFLYLEYLDPWPRARRVLGIASALLVLVLTQSKTSWGILVIAASLVVLYRDGVHGRTAARVKLGVAAALVVAVALVGAPDEILLANVEIATLTGRTELWEVALAAWLTSPVFGYGPTLWSEEFRTRFLSAEASYAAHSHNMFVQQLAESGALGFAALLAFFFVLARFAWRARYESRGLSIALLVHLTMNAMTETVLVPRAMDQTMFGTGVLLVLAIVCCSTRRGTEVEASALEDAPWLTAATGGTLGPTPSR